MTRNSTQILLLFISFQVDHKHILYFVHSSSLHCLLLNMKETSFMFRRLHRKNTVGMAYSKIYKSLKSEYICKYDTRVHSILLILLRKQFYIYAIFLKITFNDIICIQVTTGLKFFIIISPLNSTTTIG